jgi:hypothetical protein
MEKFLGSNKSKLISSIEEQLNERSAVSIKLNTVQKTEGKIDVHYSAEGVDVKKEQAILVLKRALSEIKRKNKEKLYTISISLEIFLPPLKKNYKLHTSSRFTERMFCCRFIQDKRSGK